MSVKKETKRILSEIGYYTFAILIDNLKNYLAICVHFNDFATRIVAILQKQSAMPRSYTFVSS